MNSIFYVYLHRRLSDNRPFYIGKGKGKRAFSSASRNRYWKNTVQKHGFSVEILYDCLTEEEAFVLEKESILEMNYHFADTMCNMTTGGEGSSGNKQSETTIQKRVEKNKGKKRTEEQRLNISDGVRGTFSEKGKQAAVERGKRMIGQKQSQETISKRAMANCGKRRSSATKELQSESAKQRVSTEQGLQQLNNARKIDKTVYRFYHVDGEEFIGIRLDFCKTHNISRVTVQNCLARNFRSVFSGWRMEKYSEKISSEG